MTLLAWTLRGCAPPMHFTVPFIYRYRQPYLVNEFIPESPLYCPQPGFYSIIEEKRCTAQIYNLLWEMRELTCWFMDVALIGPRESCEFATSSPDAICTRILGLPSANFPGHAATGDWIYESCRLAACISCFQMRAGPENNIILLVPIVHELHSALKKSDISDCWEGMSGPLFWCALVGASCMRDALQQLETANLPYSHQVRFCEQELQRHEYCRKWLTLLAVRISVILGFQYPHIICTTLGRYVHVRGLNAGKEHSSL